MTATSILENILGSDGFYDALLTKVNNLIAYRHSLDFEARTASYTAAATDQLAVIDSTSGAITVTLPAVASSANTTLFFFVKNNTNTITLDANASETINGQLTLTMPNRYESLMLFCDGAAWYAFDMGIARTRTSFTTKTTTYTATLNDEVILANASGGGFTITLPTAASAKGKRLTVKAINVSGGNVTIDGDGSETIDGATTKVLSVAQSAVTICSDGTAWHILASV